MIKEKIGSKLYILGEYSILYPNNSAILKYVKKYTYARIKFSNENTIKSSIYDYSVTLENIDENYSYIQKIVIEINKYLMYLGISILPIDISIETELFSADKKLGLGSSASLLVLLVKSILKLYSIKLSNEEIFKLCVIISYRINQKGSMGDIACIVYEEDIKYTSFDFKDIQSNLSYNRVNEDWKYLKIESFNIPYNIYYLWLGYEVSTNKTVNNFNKYVEDEYILEKVKKIQDILNSSNISFLEKIKLNNEVLKNIGEYILTPFNEDINNIFNYTKKYENVYIKISGSIGGDGLILLASNDDVAKKLKDENLIKEFIKV